MFPAGKTNMAIYFADSEYLESFMNYISGCNTGFVCIGFTKGDSLVSYAGENDIAVLLTDVDCFENGAKHVNSEMTVVLTERPDVETAPDVYTVNILQPVDEIVREILKAAAKMDISVVQGMHSLSGSIYCFFSPVGRSLKTTLAVAAAQQLSDREKTMYLNLEANSGFSVLCDREYDTDLSDLMFYLRDGVRDRVSLMLQSATCNLQGAGDMPPVVNPSDLYQMSGEEIIQFLDVLQGAGYRNIVLDMGGLLPGFEKILMTSTRIYMPVRHDAMSSAKVAQLFSYFMSSGDTEVSERIIRVEPPYFRNIPRITTDLRGTEVGMYAAKLIGGINE